MKNIYFIWVFIIVLILGTVTFLGLNITKRNEKYRNLESDMESIVGKYLGEHLNEYPKSGSKRFELSYIIEQGYNIDLNVNNDICDGYVMVSKESVSYSYDAYIKCNDYVTKGYAEK